MKLEGFGLVACLDLPGRDAVALEAASLHELQGGRAREEMRSVGCLMSGDRRTGRGEEAPFSLVSRAVTLYCDTASPLYWRG